MIGLYFFALVGIGIWLVYVAIRWWRPQWNKVAVLIAAIPVFVLIVGTDHWIAKAYFHRLCEAEKGIKIYKTVKNVEGYYDDLGFGPVRGDSERNFKDKRDSLLIRGYLFSEVANDRLGKGEYYRYSLAPNNELKIEQNIPKPTARYHQIRARSDLNFWMGRSVKQVVDTQTNEILAEDVSFYFNNGVVMRFYLNYLMAGVGSGFKGEGCSSGKRFIVEDVLEPVNRKAKG